MDFSVGWFTDLTNWFREQILAVWHAFETFLHDVVLFFLDTGLNLIATAIEFFQPPDFITQYSLCALLSAAGPTVGWIVQTFHVTDGLSLISAAYAFRFVRKLLTLGFW